MERRNLPPLKVENVSSSRQKCGLFINPVGRVNVADACFLQTEDLLQLYISSFTKRATVQQH